MPSFKIFEFIVKSHSMNCGFESIPSKFDSVKPHSSSQVCRCTNSLNFLNGGYSSLRVYLASSNIMDTGLAQESYDNSDEKAPNQSLYGRLL